MVDGIKEAISKVKARKEWYKSTAQPYYRPWIILMTDGYPDSGQDVTGASAEIEKAVNDKNFIFFAVGVQGADMKVLTSLSSSAMPPAPLQGLKFAQFFRWLSASMTTVTSSTDGDKVDLPEPTDWMKGFTI